METGAQPVLSRSTMRPGTVMRIWAVSSKSCKKAHTSTELTPMALKSTASVVMEGLQ